MKLKWRVQPEPTGRYRSFKKRGWPTAEYIDGCIAASISCEDDYVPARVKSGDHKELVVRVADYSVKPWKWRTVKARASTLEEAKALVVRVLEAHAHFQPAQDI